MLHDRPPSSREYVFTTPPSQTGAEDTLRTGTRTPPGDTPGHTTTCNSYYMADSDGRYGRWL
ncbi:hypothetical protein GCM10027262_76360 [Nocardia tengchongensis]